jgi:glycosyltransferase involved in cell wall biosynthesis
LGLSELLPDSLSLVIPAYNEAARLPQTIDQLRGWGEGKNFSFWEVLVVDDGSRDATAALVEQAGAPFHLLRNPGNRGKGYAVRNGMLTARGDWRLSTDADLSSPIEELTRLYTAAREQGCEIAIGSRALDRSLVGVHQPLLREMSGRLFNLFMRAITGLPYRDTQCGFKLFSAGAAERIFSAQTLEGFSFDVENLMEAHKLGIPVCEVPVRWNNVEGTKVSLATGLRSFRDVLEIKRRHRRT